MIRSFRHRGLCRLFERNDQKDLPPHRVKMIGRVLTHLDIARGPEDLRLPAYKLHPLTGDRRGYWSIRITRNWRITFRFDGPDVADVDFEDYH